MDIKEIIDKIKTEEIIAPGDLAEYRLQLAAEYGFLSEKLSKILRQKPDIWLEIRQREQIGSDKLADKVWDSTDFGKDEMELRMSLKSIEKILSAISTRLQTYETEARLQS